MSMAMKNLIYGDLLPRLLRVEFQVELGALGFGGFEDLRFSHEGTGD